MSADVHIGARRYGCHECREDIDAVIGGRASPQVRALFDAHLAACNACRTTHRVMQAVYQGPAVPTPPSGLRADREFHAALRRISDEARDPWYHRWSVRTGVAVLTGCAAALTLSLFDLAPTTFQLGVPETASEQTASAANPDVRGGRRAFDAEPSEGGIGHPAQEYGRIVGGNALIVPPGDAPSTSNTFGVGTRFAVEREETLQVGLVGKMVANFAPSTSVTWVTSSPGLIELEIERGIGAFRYDRRPSDPALEVRTPTAIVRVVGTVFTVQVDESDDTLVSVLRGHVEVLHPRSHHLVAEVESGYRYDVAKGTYDNVGQLEVATALPLSLGIDHAGEAEATPEGRIPANWNVPGLPPEPSLRTLAYVPAATGAEIYEVPSIRVTGTTSGGSDPGPLLPPPVAVRAVDDEGDDLLADLMRDAQKTRRKELLSHLGTCKTLYDSHQTRYRAAACFSNFLDKYDHDSAAAEAWLMLGILRMDYALDYRAAEVALSTFLQRAPGDPNAELALYRMWLAAVEEGRIREALKRGRRYLDRYRSGRYVGKILERFPELKSAI